VERLPSSRHVRSGKTPAEADQPFDSPEVESVLQGKVSAPTGGIRKTDAVASAATTTISGSWKFRCVNALSADKAFRRVGTVVPDQPPAGKTVMKSNRSIIAAAIVALFAAGAFSTYPTSQNPASEAAVTAMKTDEGVPQNLIAQHRSDEGVPQNLIEAMKSDEGVPQNLIAQHRSDEGVPQNLVTTA
jgi:hypothetical protein